jgi:hypothetical protein
VLPAIFGRHFPKLRRINIAIHRLDWPGIHRISPLEWSNKGTKRRTDVVGVFLNEPAAVQKCSVRLAYVVRRAE